MTIQGRWNAVWLVAALGACGGGGSTPDGHIIIAIDGGADAQVAACNVNAQSGCEAGEKCAWVRVVATPDSQLGIIGCVPDGDVGLDGECTWGASGETTGYDDCMGGMHCKASSETEQAVGICKDTCSLDGSGNTCGTGFACARYANTFANTSETPLTGLCDELCDPLTQKTLTGTDTVDTFCRKPLDANSKQQAQCVGAPAGASEVTDFTCASVLMPPAGSVDNGHRHVVSATEVYLNSCGPRALPLLAESTDNNSMTICTELCLPGEAYTGHVADIHGVSPFDLPTLGVVDTNEECRFWWFLEDANATMSDYTNGLGFALNYTKYHYDDDNDAGTPDVGFPSCSSLANTDVDGDGTVDNLAWACAPVPAALVGSARPHTKVKLTPAWTQDQFNAVLATFQAEHPGH